MQADWQDDGAEHVHGHGHEHGQWLIPRRVGQDGWPVAGDGTCDPSGPSPGPACRSGYDSTVLRGTWEGTRAVPRLQEQPPSRRPGLAQIQGKEWAAQPALPATSSIRHHPCCFYFVITTGASYYYARQPAPNCLHIVIKRPRTTWSAPLLAID